MILLCIFIIQAFTAVLCQDIDVEAKFVFDNSFLKIMQDFVKYTPNNTLRTNNHFEINSKGNLPHPSLSYWRRGMDGSLNDNNDTKTPKEPNLPQDFVDRLKQRGVTVLTTIGRQIIDETKSKKNITSVMKTVIDNYENMMDSYYKYINDQEPQTNKLDKNFFYLDMVETSSRLLYTEEKKILDYVLNDLNDAYTQVVTKALNEKIFKVNVKNKKAEIEYVCYKYDICHHYPAFSDYCADFISEVLKLPEKQLKEFIRMVSKVFLDNYQFFEEVTEKNQREKLEAKLKTFTDDMSKMKELLAVIRKVIIHRFKLIESKDHDLKNKTEAMRILIHIIDKALSEDDDIIGIDIDNTVHALRRWAGGVRQHLDEMIFDVGKSFFSKMKRNISKSFKGEMSGLLETISSTKEREDRFAIHKGLINSMRAKYQNGIYEPNDNI